MRKEIKKLTTAQFAKLHEVNKRTLIIMMKSGFSVHLQNLIMAIAIMIFHKV